MNIVDPIFVQAKNKPSELALCAPGTDFNLVSYARLQRIVNNDRPPLSDPGWMLV